MTTANDRRRRLADPAPDRGTDARQRRARRQQARRRTMRRRALVYREAGQVHSFGIASMISWRGVWYVVHLGAVLRAADEGVVDQAAAGSGSSTCSGTC
jgi:hypothetical protein